MSRSRSASSLLPDAGTAKRRSRGRSTRSLRGTALFEREAFLGLDSENALGPALPGPVIQVRAESFESECCSVSLTRVGQFRGRFSPGETVGISSSWGREFVFDLRTF